MGLLSERLELPDVLFGKKFRLNHLSGYLMPSGFVRLGQDLNGSPMFLQRMCLRV